MLITILPTFRFRFVWLKSTNKVDRKRIEKETVAEVLRSLREARNQFYYSKG